MKTLTYRQQIKEIDMFFEGRDQVHKTMRRLVRRLERAKITYAILGGMALPVHGYRRTTLDLDVLLTAQGFSKFQELFVPKNYSRIPGRPRRFIDRANEVTVDFLITGLYPGTGKPGPIAFPDPSKVSKHIGGRRVVDLVTLIQLKLAARRYRDFGDVVELIRFNELTESFADQLHASVQGDFIECLEEKRREDEYEARGG